MRKLVFAICLTLGAPALAQEAIPAPCSRTIDVGTSAVGRAMIIEANGQVRGALRDFLDDVEKRTACTFNYQPLPRARALAMLESGAIDLLGSATQAPERDRVARFVLTHTVRPVLVTMSKRQTLPANRADLLASGLEIGVVRGYLFGPGYDAILNDLEAAGRLHRVPDPETIARLLAAGRIHAAVLPPPAFADAAEKTGIAQKLRFGELKELGDIPAGFYISTTRLSASDFATLEKAIRAAVANGSYAQAMRRHYPAWSLYGTHLYGK